MAGLHLRADAGVEASERADESAAGRREMINGGEHQDDEWDNYLVWAKRCNDAAEEQYEKDKEIQTKVNYIANLKDIIWHLKNSFACKTYRFDQTADGFQLVIGFGRK
jgi:hypothetical protein